MTIRTNRRASINGEEWGEHGGVSKIEGAWESMDGGGIEEFLADREVGSSMGEIRKEWGSVLECGG